MSPRPLPLAISAAAVAAALGYLLGSAGAMDASDDGAPIVYSGRIEGTPAPAALDVEVRVVDSSDGAIVCGPYPVAGVGDDGRFEVELRDCRDAFEADAPLDVEVIIDGETVSTRAVGAVPQAVVAERATGELRAELDGLAVPDDRVFLRPYDQLRVLLESACSAADPDARLLYSGASARFLSGDEACAADVRGRTRCVQAWYYPVYPSGLRPLDPADSTIARTCAETLPGARWWPFGSAATNPQGTTLSTEWWTTLQAACCAPPL